MREFVIFFTQYSTKAIRIKDRNYMFYKKKNSINATKLYLNNRHISITIKWFRLFPPTPIAQHSNSINPSEPANTTSSLQPHEVTPWSMDFSGGFLSQQNTDSPESFHSSFPPFWLSCQGNPTLRNSRNLFTCATTENCVLLTTTIWDVIISKPTSNTFSHVLEKC